MTSASKPGKRGRPPLGSQPSVVVTFRLTADELAIVREQSIHASLTLSQALRTAVMEWAKSDPDGPR